jgi:hypothetical protein
VEERMEEVLVAKMPEGKRKDGNERNKEKGEAWIEENFCFLFSPIFMRVKLENIIKNSFKIIKTFPLF